MATIVTQGAANEVQPVDLNDVEIPEGAVSVSEAVDRLDIAELEALTNYASKVRAQKIQAKREDMVREFQKVAASMGLSPSEAMASIGAGGAKGGKLPPKYIGPNGEEYTGRGPTPRWLVELEIKGHNREEYAVKSAA